MVLYYVKKDALNRVRTYDLSINSRMLYRLSYESSFLKQMS